LGQADGLVVVHPLALADPAEDVVLLAVAFGGDEHEDGLADGLLGGVPEDPLGPGVPRRDHPVERLAHDGVVGGGDDGGQQGLRALGRLLPGDVHEHVDGADDLAVAVAEELGVGEDVRACAVGPLDDDLLAADAAPLAEGEGHGARVEGERGAGGAVDPPRAAPEVLADLGAAAPQLGGALVEEGDAPLPVRRVDRHLQGVERAAEVVPAPAHRPVRVGLATGVEGRLDLGVPWVRHGGERHGASERAKNIAHGPAGMSAVGWNRGTPYSTVTAPDPGAGRPAARRRWPRWSAVRGLPHPRAIPRNSGRLALGRPPPPRRLRRQPDRWLYEGHALR